MRNMGVGQNEFQVPHSHGPALGNVQARVVEQGNNLLEFNVAVAAVEVIEKTLPVPRGSTKIDGQHAAAGL